MTRHFIRYKRIHYKWETFDTYMDRMKDTIAKRKVFPVYQGDFMPYEQHVHDVSK